MSDAKYTVILTEGALGDSDVLRWEEVYAGTEQWAKTEGELAAERSTGYEHTAIAVIPGHIGATIHWGF